MGQRLFLLAFIVSTGLVVGKPTNENDPHEVRENFRNLFNSIKENDVKKTDSLRTALEEGAAREKQAFDSMKEVLQSTRRRTADERRTLDHKSGDTNEKVAPSKREINSLDQCLAEYGFPPREPRRNNSAEERRYVDGLGLESRGWTPMSIWLGRTILEPKILEMCTKANRAAGLNEHIDSASLDQLATLQFVHLNYAPVSSIYVVTCIRYYGDGTELDDDGKVVGSAMDPAVDAEVEKLKSQIPKEEDYFIERMAYLESGKATKEEKVSRNPYGVWYITKGTRPDCVFYLNRYDIFTAAYREYVIDKEVCGMDPIHPDELVWESLENDEEAS